MKKYIKPVFIFYSILVELICLLTLVFFGILKDENVNFEKFYPTYVLGFEFNYYFLLYLALTLGIFSIILQLLFIFKFILKKLHKKSGT
jgi:hypothetical protein